MKPKLSPIELRMLLVFRVMTDLKARGLVEGDWQISAKGRNDHASALDALAAVTTTADFAEWFTNTTLAMIGVGVVGPPPTPEDAADAALLANYYGLIGPPKIEDQPWTPSRN